MYLVDSNIWLERLLAQDRSDEVGRFLDLVTSNRLFITDFAFHSIAVIMTRLKQMDAFLQFVRDAFIDGSVSLIHLSPGDSHSIIRTIAKYNMDFDDAYQYVAAEKHHLVIVIVLWNFKNGSRGV